MKWLQITLVRPCYAQYQPFFQGKAGLEVGGPSPLFRRNSVFPVYAVASRIDNCNFSSQTIWEGTIQTGSTFSYDPAHPPGTQYIAEATNLHCISTMSYDFMLSSHTLEHVANPLQALSEVKRILKPEGVLVLILPHKEGSPDHRRPVATLAHLIQDFEQQTPETDLTHLDEVVALHDRDMDEGAWLFNDLAAFKWRCQQNATSRGMHHHVFGTHLAIEMVNFMGLQVLHVEAFLPFHILLVAQKPQVNRLANNDVFLRMPPVWDTPFLLDQRTQSI